ncbi:hypothetical protein RRG08_048291 [Elysia crispata]|uniref:Secreted protein n=1 Tax=Elysia crispata TaxID=231223 RepID=A0AAE1DLH3_9GAST|nr:hypothetical protein RRG08_048291 [Elysia crispata]
MHQTAWTMIAFLRLAEANRVGRGIRALIKRQSNGERRGSAGTYHLLNTRINRYNTTIGFGHEGTEIFLKLTLRWFGRTLHSFVRSCAVFLHGAPSLALLQASRPRCESLTGNLNAPPISPERAPFQSHLTPPSNATAREFVRFKQFSRSCRNFLSLSHTHQNEADAHAVSTYTHIHNGACPISHARL